LVVPDLAVADLVVADLGVVDLAGVVSRVAFDGGRFVVAVVGEPWML
jgi:hypothetical protein